MTQKFPTALVKKMFLFYLGEISDEQLREYFVKWAVKSDYKLPKMIRFLKSSAYNSEGDIVPLANETDGEVYYYDSCRRYCYLSKTDDKDSFEFVSIK
jgi:hypothetical protein